MKVGDRIYNTLTNQSGVIVCAPYLPDSGFFGLVADVRWDAERFGRTTVATRHLVHEATVR